MIEWKTWQCDGDEYYTTRVGHLFLDVVPNYFDRRDRANDDGWRADISSEDAQGDIDKITSSKAYKTIEAAKCKAIRMAKARVNKEYKAAMKALGGKT